MSTRLLPYRGKEPPPDPEWQNLLFVAETWEEIKAALALKALTAATNPAPTGAMVAWVPPASEQRALALDVPGAAPPHDMHCTLVYLGKLDGLSDEVRSGVSKVCRTVAAQTEPFEVRVSGQAVFQNEDGVCVVKLLDAPELEHLQEALVHGLDGVLEVPDTHGFTAHCTLIYVKDVDDVDPEWLKLPTQTFTIDSISLAWGPDIEEFSFRARTASALVELEYDEALHPRAENGRWSKDDGSGYRDDEGVFHKGALAIEHAHAEARLRQQLANPPESRVYIRPQGMQGETNIKELTEQGVRIAASLPNAHLYISQNTDPAYLQAGAESAEQFAAQYPHAAAAITSIVSTDLNPNTLMQVRNAGWQGYDQFSVELNETAFSMYQSTKLEDVVHASFVSGFHPVDGVKSLWDHEFGHVLDADIGPRTNYMTMVDRAHISGYAETNRSEAFAEAFAIHQAGGVLESNVDMDVRLAVKRGEAMVASAKEWINFPTCGGYLLNGLSASVSQLLELGEDYGHPFRGNQWTGGIGGGGAGTKADPIDVTSAIEAAKLISEGKYIRMPPEQVSILLDKLAYYAQDARKRGPDAPTYDLCKITVPDTNLFCAETKDIPRVEMPQLGGIPLPGSPGSRLPADEHGKVDITRAFRDRLEADGYGVSKVEVLADHLKATQNQLDGAKVAGMMTKLEERGKLSGHIFISNDNYVLDGHHRWAAAVGMEFTEGGKKSKNEIVLPVILVDAPISVLVDYANAFAKEMGIPGASVTTASLQPLEFFDESQHPRDENGRWTDGDDESTNQSFPGMEGEPTQQRSTLVLTRDETDDPHDAPQEAVAREARAMADTYSGEGYDNGFVLDRFQDEVDAGWTPGTAPALSEAATDWQRSYDNARDITVAADALRGYQAPSLDYDGQEAAQARELLNALAGVGPEGARSEFWFSSDDDDGEWGMQVQSYGANDALVRGVADPDGELLSTFQEAMESGREVSWSIAAFAEPNAGDETQWDGDQHRSSDAIALSHALDHDTGGRDPLIITMQSGEGLILDGGYEVLTGGSFRVDSIAPDKVWTGQLDSDGMEVSPDGEPLTQEDLDFYRHDDVAGFYSDVTRITITQTQTPKAVG